MWWPTMYSADHVDIFHMYTEMGIIKRTEMQLKFQNFWNPSVFKTTPKVPRIGLTRTAVNHAVVTQQFGVLDMLLQDVAWGVWLGNNRVPHTLLLTTKPGRYDNHMRNLH
jgi:hypothetical protein